MSDENCHKNNTCPGINSPAFTFRALGEGEKVGALALNIVPVGEEGSVVSSLVGRNPKTRRKQKLDNQKMEWDFSLSGEKNWGNFWDCSCRNLFSHSPSISVYIPNF